MQTQTEIRKLLEQAGLAPLKRFGQNFLVDQNLMRALVDLAELAGDETVLEIGPGTGSLTEELLERAGRVVAVEIDNGLHELLSQRLGDRANLTLLHCDVLAGKHAIRPQVSAALGREASLVANLPYNIATPLIAQCLADSWRACRGGGVRFDRLTFTVQREVADRLSAAPGSKDYGPVSVLVSLLGRLQPGPVIPATAFWPQPKVSGRILRIDFDAAAAGQVGDLDAVLDILRHVFTHRRKQFATALRRTNPPRSSDIMVEALAAAEIEPTCRPEEVSPAQYQALADALATKSE